MYPNIYSFIIPLESGTITKIEEIAAQNGSVAKHFVGYLGKNM